MDHPPFLSASPIAHYLVLAGFVAAIGYVVVALVLETRERQRRANEELSARRFANALAAFEASAHEATRAPYPTNRTSRR